MMSLNKSYNKVKLIFQALLIAIGMYFSLVALDCIVKPLYFNTLNQDVQLTITATAEKNESALANNIRISHIKVNGRSIDLSKIDLAENTQWKYDSKNDFVYAYNCTKSEDLYVKLKNVHSITIEMVQEVGSGIVEIKLDNENWERIDLYEDIDWNYISISKDFSIWVFPEKNIVLQIGIILILWLINIFWLIKRAVQATTVSSSFISAFRSGLLAISIVCFVSFIQYEDVALIREHVIMEPYSFLKAVVFVFIMLLAVSTLFNRGWISYLLIGVFLVGGSVVSNIKLLNRAVPLLPWDFTMVGEAASVIKHYEIEFKPEYIIVFLAIAVITILIWKTESVQKYSMIIRSCLLVILISGICFFVHSSFICGDIEAKDTDYRVYRVNDYYEHRGFVSAFLEYCAYLDVTEEPKTYTKNTMKKISEEIEEYTTDKGSAQPTVIAIMSESFWDIEKMDTLNFSEDVFPNFQELKNEAYYGELFTHVINGGTVVTEFEFLTGFSGEFFPEDYMVYGSFIDDEFASVVGILKNQGYETTAIHPYFASNYNRETAYQKFGFDETYFQDSFENPDIIRNYISDKSLFNKVIEIYNEKSKSGRPQFVFAVTMQNHGGYWEDTIYADTVVPYETTVYGEVAKKSIDDYVAGLHASDQALRDIVDYFRKIDDNVVIIYFGDHVSNAGPKDDRILEKVSWYSDSMKYEYETHSVPFLVWSNFQNTQGYWGTMEVGELLPTVFETYNIKSNKFWNYIQDTKDVYGASNKHMVIGKYGNYSDISLMTEEQQSIYEIYQLLQYDYIWGKRYASDLWEMK